MVTLHQDVLEAVREALDNYFDLRSFSLTCSTLRPAAIRCLLRLEIISLDRETIHMFHRFVFADPKARGQHIRGIEACSFEADSDTPDVPDAELATYFIEIIESAICLEHLFLLGLGKSFLGDTRVIPAISHLPMLAHLYLDSCQTSSDDFLRAIVSPIKTLRVSCPMSGYFKSMMHWTSTIESIKLWDIHLDVVSVSGPRFPAVHSLTASNVSGIPRLNALLYMFPSLRTLSFLLFYLPSDFDLHAVREANKRAQDAAGENSWKSFDHIYCFPIVVFALNLQCPIRRLALNCPNGRLKRPIISLVLQKARPQFLELLELNIAVPDVLSEVSGDLFPPEAQATITHLLLRIEYCPSSGPTISGEHSATLWKTLVNNLCSTVRVLRGLAYLCLIVHCDTHRNEGSAEDEFIRTLRDSDKEYDLAVEEITAAAAPSLKNIILTASGWSEPSHPKQGCRWVLKGWRVNSRGESGGGVAGADAGYDQQVEALSDDEVWSVQKREDLLDSTSRQSVSVFEYD